MAQQIAEEGGTHWPVWLMGKMGIQEITYVQLQIIWRVHAS